jgi:hypothetical protein
MHPCCRVVHVEIALLPQPSDPHFGHLWFRRFGFPFLQDRVNLVELIGGWLLLRYYIMSLII